QSSVERARGKFLSADHEYIPVYQIINSVQVLQSGSADKYLSPTPAEDGNSLQSATVMHSSATVLHSGSAHNNAFKRYSITFRNVTSLERAKVLHSSPADKDFSAAPLLRMGLDSKALHYCIQNVTSLERAKVLHSSQQIKAYLLLLLLRMSLVSKELKSADKYVSRQQINTSADKYVQINTYLNVTSLERAKVLHSSPADKDFSAAPLLRMGLESADKYVSRTPSAENGSRLKSATLLYSGQQINTSADKYVSRTPSAENGSRLKSATLLYSGS
ncbi:hypothetical protein L9F63_016882, partial [Diploptera punctata]